MARALRPPFNHRSGGARRVPILQTLELRVLQEIPGFWSARKTALLIAGFSFFRGTSHAFAGRNKIQSSGRCVLIQGNQSDKILRTLLRVWLSNFNVTGRRIPCRLGHSNASSSRSALPSASSYRSHLLRQLAMHRAIAKRH